MKIMIHKDYFRKDRSLIKGDNVTVYFEGLAEGMENMHGKDAFLEFECNQVESEVKTEEEVKNPFLPENPEEVGEKPENESEASA